MVEREQGKAPVTPEESLSSRRDFLFDSARTGLALAFASFAGCSRNDPAPEVIAAQTLLETKLSPFQERYLKDGTISDTQQLNELFLQTEHFRFIEAGGKTSMSFAQFQAEVYTPVKEEVGIKFQSLLLTADVDTDRLVLFKRALSDVLGEQIKYNRDYNSVLDPIVNQRLQCRSGTQLFLQLAREFERDVLLPGEQLVVVYTDTHELPGKLTIEGELTGYEMTTRGSGIVDFGALSACQVPLRVCADDHIAAQAILGTRIFPDKVILHDTLGSSELAESYVKPVGVSLGSSEGASVKNLVEGAMNSASECFSYSSGTVKVPEGDQEIFAREFLPTTSYQNESAPVPETGAGGVGGASVEQLPLSERKIVMNYLQHNQYFSGCWDRQAAILNDNRLGNTEKKQALRSLVGEMETYWKRNDISAARDAAGAILTPRRLAPTIEPAGIFNKIQHNLGVLERR